MIRRSVAGCSAWWTNSPASAAVRILLDTSYVYDIMDRPGKFSDWERQVLAAHETQFYVSAVSIWEMRLKHNVRHPSGMRKSPFSPEDVLVALEGQAVSFLPISMRHAARTLNTPVDHNDPFDELLLVQAQEEGLLLLTRDRHLTGHPLAVGAKDLA